MKNTKICNQTKGTIFNIQRFSIHDGPGIRTTVFFKGCNLQCLWCHNPESISCYPEIEFNQEKCIGCGSCFKVCPQTAHYLDKYEQHCIDRTLCEGCFSCCNICYAEALASVGIQMSLHDLMVSILDDKPYFDASENGGGVTFSGGEPMLQISFLQEALRECKTNGINTAVDTAGHVPWSYFEKIISYTDLFLFDMKAVNPGTHQKLTGIDNRQIISNLRNLAKRKVAIRVRTPLIMGCNEEEIPLIGDLLIELGLSDLEIIPYHKLGESKYKALSKKKKAHEFIIPSDSQVNGILSLLHGKGLRANRS